MLDTTLLMVTSEMGRKSKIGDPRSGGVSGAGRDHWTHCLTDVLAGGGIRGGQTYGSSDRFAEYPADKPVTPADITKTVYHAMGIHGLTAYDKQNRPYDLLEEGVALTLRQALGERHAGLLPESRENERRDGRRLSGLPRLLQLSSRLVELSGELLIGSLTESLLQEAACFPARTTSEALGFTRW